MFIVRRGTAGILAKSARDRFTQAVLPLSKGILGVHEASVDVALDHRDFQNMTMTLGVGICLCGAAPCGCSFFDHLRYGKIIVATEETPLGLAFRNEVLALFRRFMPPLVTEGHVFDLPARAYFGGRVRKGGDEPGDAKLTAACGLRARVP
jgi:DNA gyrase subunit B